MNKKKSEHHIPCLVDEKGQFLAEKEKEVCHAGDGLLHSTFLAIIFKERMN